MAAPRHKILGLVRGQKVTIPSLASIFSHWPGGISPFYEEIIPFVDRKLESLIADPVLLKKLKKSDFALFSAAWYPDSSLETLITAAYLTIWLFMWDDEIDESTGSLCNNFSGSQSYRVTTAQYVEQSLGLRDHGLVGADLHQNIASFDPIGEALRKSYSTEQRRRFLDELHIFMSASEEEQAMKLKNQLWDVHKYKEKRLGTSAVGTCSAMIEYLRDEALPLDVFEMPDFEIIWEETNRNVWLVNDLLSLKKEIEKGAFDSLIPLACADGTTTIEEVIESAIKDIKDSVARFDTAATSLIESIKDEGVCADATNNQITIVEASRSKPFNGVLRVNGGAKENAPFANHNGNDAALVRSRPLSRLQLVEGFIETSRQNCVGNWQWSLVTARYGLGGCKKDAEGAIHVEL